MPADTMCVTRPGKWGNPLRVGMWKDFTAADAVRQYRAWLNRDHGVRSYDNAFGKPPTVDEIRRELGGKNLACWCPIGTPCHGDLLLRIANPDLPRPMCRDCADSDGWCCNDKHGFNCGFPAGHHMHREELFRPGR